MRQVVRDVFFDFTAKREGFTPFMYCDTLNLVTTGVGNLIDNGARNGFDISDAAMAPAMKLPWKIKGPGWTPKNPVAAGNASSAEIKESWIRTKLRQQDDAAFIAAGGIKQGGFKYANFQPLTLDMDGLKALFTTTMNRFDQTLASRYPNYAEWPADAQLAAMSMAWAMGPAFNFPAFKAATDRLDFAAAADNSFFKGGGGTLEARAGRNAENFAMFNNAAMVVKGGADRDRLFFPGNPANDPGMLPNGSGGSGGGGGAGGVATITKAAPIDFKQVAKGAAEGGATIAVVGAAGWAGWELYKHFRKGGKR